MEMAMVAYTPQLAAEYQRLYATCLVRGAYEGVMKRMAARIVANRKRYEAVGVEVPWRFIGVIHAMEGDLSFGTHLHNGDPLSGRTMHEPAGRPLAGNPPFAWEESAADALRMKGLDRLRDWSVPRMLYELERYNGFGYRVYHPEVLSPYLWGGSNHYRGGKYVADGKWSAEAMSKQCGAALLLRACGAGVVLVRG